MALVDSSGRAVRSGTTGRAINSGSSRGNNNNNGGNGRAANRARSSANLAAAKAASKASAVETQRRNQDGQSQIKAAEAQALAQQQAVQQAAANRKMQEQIAAAEKQAQAQALAQQKAAQQQQQNQQGIAAYKAMMEGPVVAGNPNVVGNTYANAPTQFTEGRSGTSYYPANAPDTMFRGLMGNLTGSGLLSGAADMVGEDNPVGGFLKAYSEFDPLGDFAQQTVYGMNDGAKQEYMRQEASNPNWPTMSEKEKVQLARKPQMDNQLPHAFINDGISNTANEAQLNAMRPENMSEAQFNSLPIEMKRQLTMGSANQGDNPYIPPVEEEVIPESYTSYMADYSPMFSFAGKSGLSSFAEGGAVDQVHYMNQGGMASPYASSSRAPLAMIASPAVSSSMGGVGGLFQDMNRGMGMQQAQMGGAPLKVYGDYLNNTYTVPQAEQSEGQVTEFIDMVDQAERAHFGAEESFGYGGGDWQKGLMDQYQNLPQPRQNLSQGPESFNTGVPRPMIDIAPMRDTYQGPPRGSQRLSRQATYAEGGVVYIKR